MDMKLNELLDQIERKPELFIGGRDIHALRHFLSGYILAMGEYDPTYHDELLPIFTAYLAQKYSDNRDYDWATLIAIHEADGDTVDAFFRLMSEYRSKCIL